MKRWSAWLRKEQLWLRIRTQPHGLDTGWRGLRLLMASAPLLVTGSLALRVLFSLVPVMQVWLMKQLIDCLKRSLDFFVRWRLVHRPFARLPNEPRTSHLLLGKERTR